ncbi:MAG: hypothetical protein HC934_07790 [Acaryochloridaceae cyanobacterium SU_2_1]|nr:hypothetical protein [Acaryochloridaceae cyanobacterium SU_2_1]
MTDAVARPHRRDHDRSDSYEYDDREFEQDRFKRRLKQRRFNERRLNRLERKRRNQAIFYPRRVARYRTVRDLPHNCSRRIVQDREFYYNASNRSYYRYYPEQDAYFVIGANDIRDFITNFF